MPPFLYIEDIGRVVMAALSAAAIVVVISIVFLYNIIKKSKYKTVSLILISVAVFFLTTWLVLNEIIDNQ
jgi:hypothetical protein